MLVLPALQLVRHQLVFVWPVVMIVMKGMTCMNSTLRGNFEHFRNTLKMIQWMIKPTICICETKGADQLCSNCTADHGL